MGSPAPESAAFRSSGDGAPPRRHVVSAAELQVDLERAGLTVVSRAVVPGAGPRHRTVLVEAVRTEDQAAPYLFVA